jgi:site-specific DNA recombinase
LIDALGLIGESSAKTQILKRVEELAQANQEIEKRILMLEGATCTPFLADGELEELRYMLSEIESCLDLMSVEEQRETVRSVVRKIIWDGEHAHVMLFDGGTGKT